TITVVNIISALKRSGASITLQCTALRSPRRPTARELSSWKNKLRCRRRSTGCWWKNWRVCALHRAPRTRQFSFLVSKLPTGPATKYPAQRNSVKCLEHIAIKSNCSRKREAGESDSRSLLEWRCWCPGYEGLNGGYSVDAT